MFRASGLRLSDSLTAEISPLKIHHYRRGMIIAHVLKLRERINSIHTKTTGCIKKLKASAYSYTHKNRERKTFTSLQITVIRLRMQ